MLKFLKSKAAKTVGGLMVLGLLVSSTASAALTTDQVNAILGLLNSFGADATTVANVQASLTGGSPVVTVPSTTKYDFGTLTLRVGSKGVFVKNLQLFLGASADGIFGPMTKAKVVAWQSNNGLTADGLFGALSRAVANAGIDQDPGTVVVDPSVPPVSTGPVVATLAYDNPASGTIVAGQATADLAHFTFSGSGTVTGLTLQRLGVSADTTPSNIYLFDGVTRLTDAASVTSTGTVTFSAPAGLFTVNGLKTISVKSDITTGTQGQTVGMMLASFTTSSGTTSVNLSGNVHTVATATLASVSAGTVTPSGATINPAAAVTVWQSTLTVSQRDVLMKRIALRNVGSATASNFQNFKLYVNGVQVSTALGLDADGYVTFDLSSAPVTLVSGARVVRVDADIVSGASNTFQFSLRKAADVDFVDSSFGVNITPTGTPWTSTASTISGASGGSLTVEKDISSPSTNLTLSGSDVNLGTFVLTAYGEAIDIETLTAGFTYVDTAGGNNAAATLRNGRLLINGVQYGSTATLVPAGTSFTLNYTVNPGTPVLVEVHADVYDNDGLHAAGIEATDTILAKLVTGSSNAERVDSLGSFNVPSGVVSANTLTVATTSIALTKNATYSDQTTVVPATNFKIGSWNLAGSSVEDVLLTTLSFDVDEVNLTTFNEDDITNMYVVVKNGSTIVAQPSPLGTVSATDNNYSINYTLAKNAIVTIELYGNFGSTVTSAHSFKTDLSVSGTSLVSGQSVSSNDKDGQTIAYGAATITVSKDASSPIAAIAYDNQTVTALAAKFEAVTAAYNITDMTVTVGASANTVVQAVMVYDGTTLVASSPLTTATTAVINGLNVNIPANTNKVLTIKLQLGAVGIGAGTSGATLTTSIAAATDVVYTNVSTGVSTSSSTEEAGTATGSAMYAYAAVPTVNRVAIPTTVLASGTQVLAKFDVVSNGGTVAWKQVLLDITKSAAPTITSVELYDVTGGANTLVTAAETFQLGGLTGFGAGGGVATTCVADVAFCELLISVGTDAHDSVEEQVSGTKTYEVRATIGGVLAAANAINVSIQSNLNHAASATYLNTNNDQIVDDASFVWSDQSAQSHSTGTLDWVNENLVRVLPTSTWTMTYPN